MKPSLIVAGALMLATSAVGAATTEVLVRSGDLATDGVRVAGFEEPVGTGDVAFRGTTSALMTRSGDTFTVLIRTGDALPAPLAGSFATFANPVINDAGAVAFHAAGTGPARVDGVFVTDAGATTVDAFAARDTAGAPNDAIYVSRNGGLTRLVGTGDPSPLGGTITGIDTGTTLTFRGNAVVYAATLSGASAPAALLATTP